MGAGLVGNDIRRDAAADQFRQHIGAIANQSHREWRLAWRASSSSPSASSRSCASTSQYLRLYALLDARGIDIDSQEASAIHGGRERLSAAHAAHAAGDDQSAQQRSAEMRASGSGEGFVSALHDSLARDVDPGTGGHLAIHGEPELFQALELIEVRPMSDQVRIRDQYARSFGCVRKMPTGLPDCTSSVSSFSRLCSDRTMAWKHSQLRAALPVPP